MAVCLFGTCSENSWCDQSCAGPRIVVHSCCLSGNIRAQKSPGVLCSLIDTTSRLEQFPSSPRLYTASYVEWEFSDGKYQW